MKIKLTVELVLVIAFMLTAMCHSWGLFNVPFWLYLVFGVTYLIFELVGFNDKEL